MKTLGFMARAFAGLSVGCVILAGVSAAGYGDNPQTLPLSLLTGLVLASLWPSGGSQEDNRR